jgi:glycosyltransferase involved in cell wall biosynthesis
VTDYQVVLLGNYAPDRQQSMLRFGQMLRDGWGRRGVAAFLIQPEPWLAARAPARLRKWAAYVDKYVRFPPRAARLAAAAGWDAAKPTVFHICDHSNSIYLRGLPGRRVVLTCHDLLAVRGARGEPTYCPASPTGRILQSIILSYLRHVPWVACVSDATRADFRRLTGRADDPRVATILNSFNAPFAPVARAEAAARLARFPGLLDISYVLHVGSGEPRKNRVALLRTLALARPRWPGRVVFAGEPLTAAERDAARPLGLPDEAVREILKPSHEELSALYSCAHALLFPSFSEGFGWPVIEAQACDCPVICSNVTSLPEIVGSTARMRTPEDFRGFAEDIIALTDPAVRAALVTAGRANIARFSEDRMLDAYANLYQRALA